MKHYIPDMKPNVIRLASYNMRKAKGLDQKRLPERTLSVINQLDADVVVLQEADRRHGIREPAIARELIEVETDFQLVEVSSNSVSLGWHGNAVLVRNGYKVSHVERLDLPGLEPRGAVRVDIEVGAGFSLIAAHLGLLRQNRRKQLDEICMATAGCAQTVIAGDFNEWSKNRGLEPLSERFDIHAPGLTFHARRPMASLDRFALSNIELRDAGVNQGELAKIASDHLPIWCDIEIPSAPPIC
jgi:endonuclease/exonuclease/phosphatase family metal-dependent hydrolase